MTIQQVVEMEHARINQKGITPDVMAAVDFLVEKGLDDEVRVWFEHDLPYYYGKKWPEVNAKIDNNRNKYRELPDADKTKILEQTRPLLEKAGVTLIGSK